MRRRIIAFVVLLACLGGWAALGRSPACGALSAAQVKRAAVGMPPSVARWAPTVNKYWGRWLWKYQHRRLTVTELRRALFVMRPESGGRAWARNPVTGHTGLFQLHPGFSRGKYNLRHGPTNISLAGQLYVRRGWSAWPWTRRRGWR